MITIGPQTRIFVQTAPVNFKNGIDGLAAQCREVLQLDPFSGALFVFRNKLGTSIKILFYDSQGFWLAQKRFSQGKLKYWPQGEGTAVTRQLASRELNTLLAPECIITMRIKSTGPAVDINAKDYEALTQRVRTNSLDGSDCQLLVTILETFRFLQTALEQKRVAISKLRELFFGRKTEKDPKKKKVRDKAKDLGASGAPPPAPASGSEVAAASISLSPLTHENNLQQIDLGTSAAGSDSTVSTTREDQILDRLDPPKADGDQPATGHGRRASDSWENADEIRHCHTCLQAGQTCPACNKGKLNLYYKPAVFARIVGTAPLGIEVHKCDRLRVSTWSVAVGLAIQI